MSGHHEPKLLTLVTETMNIGHLLMKYGQLVRVIAAEIILQDDRKEQLKLIVISSIKFVR
ncbi:hypothetical protein J2Z37_004976 [Ammoniphilus resinae]|uniref:Uncharacterized protein n=1 Tax=Ammoniphilus resinae TaxID=861532 RepID=A0ABS4GXH7_9BACL|nr:hypothetical protein [Ammoniphilus resinae]